MKLPHASSAPVRMDSLARGAEFTAAFGGHYTYERPDGVSSGAHRVLGRDGRRTMFAGCAEVTLGRYPRGWREEQAPTLDALHLVSTAPAEPVPHDASQLLTSMREVAAKFEAEEEATRANLRALPQPGPDEGAEAILLMAPNEMGGGSILFASAATVDALARLIPLSPVSSALGLTGIRILTTPALPLPATPSTDEEGARDAAAEPTS